MERAEAAHELTHEQREALRSDLTRIREFFDAEFDRDGARGVARSSMTVLATGVLSLAGDVGHRSGRRPERVAEERARAVSPLRGGQRRAALSDADIRTPVAIRLRLRP